MAFSSYTTLEPFSALGMADIPNSGPCYISDSSIIFPVGNQVVQQSLDTGERIFLLKDRIKATGARTTKLTAFSLSADGSTLAMACCRKDDCPILTVYSLPSGNTLMQMPQEVAREIHFTAFHRSMKLGLMLVTEPRLFSLQLFNPATKAIGKSVKFSEPYEVACFHPMNDSMILLFCSKALAYYVKGENQVRSLPVPNYSRFSGFAFSLSDGALCAAASGRDLLFFQNMELKHTMTITEESNIVYLTTFLHGFIVATENGMLIFIHYIPGFKDFPKSFQQGTCLSYEIPHPIVWSSFSPSNHQMVCNVDHRQLLIVNTREFESNTDNSIINPNIVSHKGPVAAISSCAYKPLFVSCGAEDKTVIVWDYSKQVAVLHSEFAEGLTDVSFHPSGDMVAVASVDKLYLLAVTVDSLVNKAEWPLFNCLSIEFSNGGHFLVAASHIITFINPYTQEIIATLRGHTGLIHSLSWSPDDKRLVSSGSDGCIVEWNAVSQQQMWTVTVPKSDFSSSVIMDRGTAVACSKTAVVQHLFAGRHQAHVAENMPGFSCVSFATPSCLILGDVLGGIAAVPFPFIVPPQYQTQFENVPQLEYSDGQEVLNEFANIDIPFVVGDVFRSHCGNVNSVCSSLDGKVLFSCANDASICIFNILSPNQAYVTPPIPILRCDIPRQQFFLVSQSRYDELQHAIHKLKKDIQKQQVTYETTTIESLQQHEKNMRALTEQQDEKRRELQGQIDALRDVINDSTVKATRIYENMEAEHLKEARTLTNLYEQKLALENSKCAAIEKEVEDLKCSYEERIYLLRQQYKSSLQEFTEKVDHEQTQLNENLEATKTKISESEAAQTRSLIELELEFEKDRMQINLEYHNKIIALEKLHKELVEKADRLELETQKQDTEIAELKADLDRVKEKKNELDKEIKSQQHTFECRTSELNDRDETLMRQAERLERLQTSNSELQKNKDIMQYRLEEMGRELQPSLDEITRLQSELDGNSEEIRTIKRYSKANRRTMRDKQHQIEVLKRKLEVRRATLQKKRRIIQMFTMDLQEAVARTDPSSQANSVKELHDKYVAAQNLEETLKDANEATDERTRQRKHLQQSVMLLQRQAHQQQEITTKHFVSKAAENSHLLGDLNRLQKENNILKKKLDNAHADIDMLETNLKKVRQASHDQKLRQARSVKSALAPQRPHMMGEWVKQKSRVGQASAVSVVDGRGRFVHSGAKG